MKPIPFFTDTIRIRPHSATNAKYCDRTVSLREFCGGNPCALYELENGELRAELRPWRHGNARTGEPRIVSGCQFIEGPEAV